MYRNYALGARIKAAMKATGFKTAKEFCEKHNIHYLTFAQHVQGRRQPNTEFLSLYANVFGVTSSWLETGEGNPFSHPKKTKQLLKISQTEIDKRLAMNKLMHNSLDIELLTKILKQVLSACNIKTKTSRPEQLAKAISYIYSDISEMSDNNATKEKLIKVALNTFFRNIK